MGDEEKPRGNVRVSVITVPRETELVSKGMGDPVNPSKRLVVNERSEESIFGRDVVTPPFDLYALAKIPQQSSILPQCITAMELNIEAYGWDVQYIGPENKDQSKAALDEKKKIESFFLTVNDRESFVSLRRKLRRDMETTGNGYWEVIRDTAGDIAGFEHLPSVTMRLLRQDDELVEIEGTWLGPDGEVLKRTVQRRFRRYCQIINTNNLRVYFKEFGDPRTLNARTGQYDDNTPDEDVASECWHFPIYDPCHAYGIPRWIGVLPAILGSRFAETVNLRFWEKQGIPAMAVLVSGGALTPESMEMLKKVFEEEALGADNFHRVVVLEATPMTSGIDDKGSIKIDMRPLQGERQQDAVFQQYDTDNVNKVRSAFRLPPIFVGRSEDHNYATALASQQIAEQQVFSPEREHFDELINLTVMRSLEISNWKFFSKGPEITDMNTFSAAVQTFSDVGALTPNAAIGLMNELLGTDVAEIEEDWGNLSFTLVKILAQAGTLDGLDAFVKQVDPATQNPDGSLIPPPPQPPGQQGAKQPPDAKGPPNDQAAASNGKKPPKQPAQKDTVQRLEEIEHAVIRLVAQEKFAKRMGRSPLRPKRRVRY